MELKNLKGKIVTLKPLREFFFPQYLKMFSPKVRELLHVSSKDSEIEYLYDRLEKQKEGKTFFYCIFDNETGLLVGAIEIRNPQEADSQLYSWLNEKYWGTGRYQEALRLVSEKYFEQSRTSFYRANVDISNIRSYKALKKYGFIDSGLKKGPHGGQYMLICRRK